jgi:hypothetical protein
MGIGKVRNCHSFACVNTMPKLYIKFEAVAGASSLAGSLLTRATESKSVRVVEVSQNEFSLLSTWKEVFSIYETPRLPKSVKDFSNS